MRLSLAPLAFALAAAPACVIGGDDTMDHDMAAVVVDTVGLREKPVPAEFEPGRQRFQTSCVACHGQAALGTAHGPPLVHRYYHPRHHADAAFRMAAIQGVRSHHWNFGDMPPVPGLQPGDVDQILAYVRWLQREAGLR